MEIIMTPSDKEALETDYTPGEVSRDEAERYPLVKRGSIRLVCDLYRTEQEQREFIEKGLKLKLPGQKGYWEFPHFVRAVFNAVARMVRVKS